MTYLGLAIATVVVAVVGLAIARKRINWLAWVVAALVLIAMTAVFDNLIILSGIVAYKESLISGIKLWLAPVEDFSYTLFALGLVPAIWEGLNKKK